MHSEFERSLASFIFFLRVILKVTSDMSMYILGMNHSHLQLRRCKMPGEPFSKMLEHDLCSMGVFFVFQGTISI